MGASPIQKGEVVRDLSAIGDAGNRARLYRRSLSHLAKCSSSMVSTSRMNIKCLETQPATRQRQTEKLVKS